jgi:hypothetical protein
MNMLFDFAIIVFNNHMFKYYIKIHWNTWEGYNLQNRLQVDEILKFSYFQVKGALKCICKLPSF